MSKKTFALLSALLAFSLSFSINVDAGQKSADPDADYDRLDGTGRSGRKVHVIEWEGNLEIHVAPKGSLKGLALKLDKRNKDKPVMVIGYRFVNQPQEQLIRRAILGIDLREGFKTYRDPAEPDYDKIIISNNGLSGSVVAYQLEAEPAQLYPEGHPALAAQPAPGGDESREPASGTAKKRPPVQERPAFDEETGSIRPFYMDGERVINRR